MMLPFRGGVNLKDYGSHSALFGGEELWEKISNTRNSNLIAFWRLNETAGVVAEDSTSNSYDGVYTNVTVGGDIGIDGNPAPTLNGVNAFVNVSASGVGAKFNGDAGTILLYVKFNADNWNDGIERYLFEFRADGNNRVRIYKATTGNIIYRYASGGAEQTISLAGISGTDWKMFGITWNKATNTVRAFYNGAQTGADAGGLGVWAGVIGSNFIGSLLGTSRYWTTSVALVPVWDIALTVDEIGALWA